MNFWSYLANFFLEWEMFQTEVAEEIKSHIFMFSNFFFNHAVYEITWKNIVERGRPQMAIRRMRIARSNPQSTNTDSQYVILIAFPLQQLLHEHVWRLPYMYVAVLFLPYLF